MPARPRRASRLAAGARPGPKEGLSSAGSDGLLRLAASSGLGSGFRTPLAGADRRLT